LPPKLPPKMVILGVNFAPSGAKIHFLFRKKLVILENL
jgi:hypothetical protein